MVITQLFETKQVLEIGMFTDYGARCVVEATPEGGTVNYLRNPRRNDGTGPLPFARSPPHGKTISTHKGLALEMIRELRGPIELALRRMHEGRPCHQVTVPICEGAGQEMISLIRDVDVGLVSLTPLNSAIFPKTEAEVARLKQLMADPDLNVLTFTDGKDFKGLAADFAIEQSCADCHNHHPNSIKKDFKNGDLMGAIVVRLKNDRPPVAAR